MLPVTGAYALGLTLLACLLPMFGASRHKHCHIQARDGAHSQTSRLEQFLLDFILLGVAITVTAALANSLLLTNLGGEQGLRP